MARRREVAPERTIADWLGDEYAADRLTLEEFEVKLNELSDLLDEPVSRIKYMKGLQVPRPQPDGMRTLWT